MNPKPLGLISLILVTFSLSIGTFMQILDTSIANVAIPTIAGNLGVSANDGSWIITSFSISNGIVLPLTGWLASRWGSVRVFAVSTALFSVASWLCGFSTSLGMLVFFRVVQGAVSGSLIPLSQALLLQVYPQERRGEALGIWVTIVAVSPVIGPVLGGWITDNYSWQWIFYINIPFGFLSCFLTWHILKDRETSKERKPLDVLGIFLLIVGIGCLQVFLDRGNDWDWFRSPAIRVLSVTSFIAFTFFIIQELYCDYAVLDFSLFRNKNYLYSNIAMSLSYFIFFGALVVQPLWLQKDQGYTPFMAGLYLMPMGILPVLLSQPLGAVISHLSLRFLVTIGFILFAITFFWDANFTTQVSFEILSLNRLLMGLALTFYFTPLTGLSLVGIPPEKFASASGIFTFLRMVAGGGVGTSLYVTFFSRRGIFHHARLTEVVTSYRAPVREYFRDVHQELGLQGLPQAQFVDDVVQQQADMMAINELFWVSAWMMLFLIPIVWLCKEPVRKLVKAHS